MEAAYAEMALSGRSRLPKSYIAANKRLQERLDYMDEVRGYWVEKRFIPRKVSLYGI